MKINGIEPAGVVAFDNDARRWLVGDSDWIWWTIRGGLRTLPPEVRVNLTDPGARVFLTREQLNTLPLGRHVAQAPW